MTKPTKENGELERDAAVAVMMFGKNAKLVAKTVSSLFAMYGIHLSNLSTTNQTDDDE